MSHKSLQVDSDVDTKSLSGFKQDDVSREGGLVNLQNQLTSRLLENIPEAPDIETIMGTFEKRRALGEQEFGSFRELIKSKFGTGIEDVEAAGDLAITSQVSAQRGFATQTLALKNIATDTEKRVRNLKKDRDELVLQANFEQARRLDDLIIREEEAITSAKTNYLNQLFAFGAESRAQSAESRAQRSFQTPDQIAIRNLALQFPDIVGLTDAHTFGEALAAVAPTAAAQRELENQSLRLGNALTGVQIDKIIAETTILTTPGGNFEDATGLRKEFIDQSKVFITVRDAWGRIQASVEDPSGASDLSLIFNYMKVLDPGSVVRESEFKNAAQAASYANRVYGAGFRVTTGGFLAPETRADFLDRAGRLYNAQVGFHNQLRSEYSRLAGNAGISAENVIVDYLIAGDTEPTPSIGIEQDNLFFNLTNQTTTPAFGF